MWHIKHCTSCSNEANHFSSHLESDSILRRPGDEVVRNPRRIVVLRDFDGQRIATGVCGTVANQKCSNVLL